jgi:putative FmdB family regulatory protein
MREREAQVATTQMGRMGAEAPARISGHTLHVPIYEYRCEECGKRSSALLGSYSSADPACPHCGKHALRRLVSTFATVSSGEGDGGDLGDDFGGGEGDFGGGDDDFGGGDDDF